MDECRRWEDTGFWMFIEGRVYRVYEGLDVGSKRDKISVMLKFGLSNWMDGVVFVEMGNTLGRASL